MNAENSPLNNYRRLRAIYYSRLYRLGQIGPNWARLGQIGPGNLPLLTRETLLNTVQDDY